ncbi:hypothetical protein PR048_033569 [Dryococelus australis]|uniref:Uncharacterized protein n=1 Tax=Dryococelus australis TaxID=614101 RepID=A0ABQ9G0P0_9NEOP|nr:hypothetical protein PR048_033569 [Dryococelus australis]
MSLHKGVPGSTLQAAGRGGTVVRLLASHLGEPGWIPGGVVPAFSRVGIMSDNAAGGRIFPGVSRFPGSYIPALLHSRLASSPSALKTSILKAAQISSLTHSVFMLKISGVAGRVFERTLFQRRRRTRVLEDLLPAASLDACSRGPASSGVAGRVFERTRFQRRRWTRVLEDPLPAASLDACSRGPASSGVAGRVWPPCQQKGSPILEYEYWLSCSRYLSFPSTLNPHAGGLHSEGRNSGKE